MIQEIKNKTGDYADFKVKAYHKNVFEYYDIYYCEERGFFCYRVITKEDFNLS
jgi:hypothetical protein